MKQKRNNPKRRVAKRKLAEKPKKSRHKITFLDDDDLFVAFLGEVGWHSRAIAERTNMTECQVNYRLHKANIKRKDYRNGESKTSELVIDKCAPQVTRDLRSDLPQRFV